MSSKSTHNLLATEWLRKFFGLPIAIACALLALSYLGLNSSTEPIGSRDFVALWSGTQVFLSGVDPYQTDNLRALEQSVLPKLTDTQAFLNPPWALPLYSLMFWIPFPLARILLFVANFIALGGMLSLCIQMQFVKLKDTQRNVVICCLFLPFMLNAYYGQVSLLLLFFALLSFHLCKERMLALSALAAIPLTLKPHLFIVFSVFLLAYLIKHRKHIWLYYFLCYFVVISVVSSLMYPGIFSAWLNSNFSGISYKTSTIVTQLRLLQSGTATVWPLYLVPIVALISLAMLFYTRLITLNSDSLPLILAISVAAAPYAWFYDFCLLIPLQLVINERLAQTKLRLLPFVAVALLPQFLVLFHGLFTNELGDFYWFPFGMLLMYFTLNYSAFMKTDGSPVRT